MSPALILTQTDFMPIREDLPAMDGALDAVEAAIVAHYDGSIREHKVVDRRPGEFEGIRLALSAGDEVLSGLRIFGNPPHTRAYMLFDGETREMMALIDYGVLNSMRVGAIAGVAARHLAPKGTKTVGLIGSGWQAPTQVSALIRAVPGIERIKVYSPTQANRERFAREMTAWAKLPVEPVASIREAIDGADVVDLCAPGHHDHREPLFETDWVKPGALVISMAPSQCTEEFVESARVVAVSYENLVSEPSARPPYEGLVARGAFTPADVTRFGAVIKGEANPRQSDNDTVIYQLEGGTVQDLYVATWGYEWARERSLGLAFDLRS